MKDFPTEKNGYDKNQVNQYTIEKERQVDELLKRIDGLEEEKQQLTDELKYYKDNEQVISKSIMLAVKAGKIIEENSKNVYKEHIAKIQNLYDKWNDFLNNLSSTYPDALVSKSADIILQSLNEAIDEVLGENQQYQTTKTIISSKDSGKKDNYQNIIVRKKRPSPKVLEEDKFNKEYKEETKRLDTERLKRTFEKFNLSADENDDFLDKFLSSNNEIAFAYEKEIAKKQENKFNLSEAVKPTMELEDIMKSFDLDK